MKSARTFSRAQPSQLRPPSSVQPTAIAAKRHVFVTARQLSRLSGVKIPTVLAGILLEWAKTGAVRLQSRDLRRLVHSVRLNYKHLEDNDRLRTELREFLTPRRHPLKSVNKLSAHKKRYAIGGDVGGYLHTRSLPDVWVERRLVTDRRALETPRREEDLPKQKMEENAFAPSARAKAILRGIQIAEDDLRKSGGSYDLEQVRRLLHGVSRQSVEKRVREGSLLAVVGPNNKRFYPVVQFKEDGTLVEGLRELQEALPTKNGFAVLNFLINPDVRVDNRKPIDLLKAGEIDTVMEAARGWGEQGA